MQPVTPTMVALLAAAAGDERLTPLKVAGIALAVAGATVMLDLAHIDFRSAQTDGVLVLLISGFLYAVYMVGLSRVLAKTPRPFTIFAWASTFGAIGLAVTSLGFVTASELLAVPARAWVGVLYCAMFVSVFAQGAVSWAVCHVSATVPSLYSCLQPLCTTAGAAVIFGDRLLVRDGVGMALIIPGMAVTVWAKRRDDLAQRERDAYVPLEVAGDAQAGESGAAYAAGEDDRSAALQVHSKQDD
jgi:drug/metabolite transporter (DMT)-like permease